MNVRYRVDLSQIDELNSGRCSAAASMRSANLSERRF
jgi:hypothetical protein